MLFHDNRLVTALMVDPPVPVRRGGGKGFSDVGEDGALWSREAVPLPGM